MRYDRRTKNQQRKLLPGHKQGARRDEPEQSVHLSLLLMSSHAVRCCLLVVTITGAPGTACAARAPMPRHATPRHATQQHWQPRDTALPKAPRATEAWSSLCQADSWSSSEGCTIFNNHLVIIIMQKRDTAVNRCNCCIYPWYALTVQSLSVIGFTRIHLRWFVAVEKTGKERLILVKRYTANERLKTRGTWNEISWEYSSKHEFLEKNNKTTFSNCPLFIQKPDSIEDFWWSDLR